MHSPITKREQVSKNLQRIWRNIYFTLRTIEFSIVKLGCNNELCL